MPKTLLKMAIFVELTIMLICIDVGNLWSSCEVHQYTSNSSNWHPNWHQRGVSGWASRISNLPDHFYCPPGGNCFHCSYHSGFQQEYCCHGSGKWKLVFDDFIYFKLFMWLLVDILGSNYKKGGWNQPRAKAIRKTTWKTIAKKCGDCFEK